MGIAVASGRQTGANIGVFLGGIGADGSGLLDHGRGSLAGVTIVEMAQDLEDDAALGDEADDGHGLAAVRADERICFVDPPNQLRPAPSSGGVTMWLGVGGLG